ncbi:MAG: hypothetical protein FJ297_08495 [Planctomycetes bacterium]|nr:hypothetical protein [Planctomycetota bacterium]
MHQSEQREEDEAVRLIGFVDVGAMKALLAFDGKIRGMEAGAVHANVEVVAIDPPRVTLQRGRERWITALFEQPVVNQQGRDHAGRSAGPQVTIGQQSSAGGQRSGGPSMFGGPGRRGAAGEWPGMSSGAGPGALNPPGAIGLPPLPGLPGEGDAGQSGGTDGSPTVPGLPGIPLPGAGTGPPTP